MTRVAAAFLIGALLAVAAACTPPSPTRPDSQREDPLEISQPARNTTAMWGYDPGLNASWAVAQTFTVPRDGLSIAAVTVWVEAVSGEGLTVEIHELSSAGTPFGERLQTIQLDSSQIQPYRDWRIEVTPPLPAKPSAAYSFVVLPEEGSSIQLGLQNTNPYVGGQGFSFDPHPDHGWRPEAFDLTFTIDLTNDV